NYGAYAFVEDFWQESTSCLDTDARTVKFGNVKSVPLGSTTNSWVPVTRSQGYGDAVFTPNHNEVCVNYEFKYTADGAFQLTSGGPDVFLPLNLPGKSGTASF
ncbi:UNVERIFIED_CONTAM: hypothetical protein HDU68_005865, partial [Siphonaria sp. JEL0065]